MFDEASEDQLLVYGLASLGAMAGGVHGASGAAYAVKLTRKDVRTSVEEFPGTAKATYNKVRNLFAELGELVGEEAHGDGSFAIRVLIGSGYGGLNPAVVTAEVTSNSQTSTQVSMRAAAREGLIKQRSADKALTKIIQWLNANAD